MVVVRPVLEAAVAAVPTRLMQTQQQGLELLEPVAKEMLAATAPAPILWLTALGAAVAALRLSAALVEPMGAMAAAAQHHLFLGLRLHTLVAAAAALQLMVLLAQAGLVVGVRVQ